MSHTSISERILSRDQRVLLVVNRRAEEGTTIKNIVEDVGLTESQVRRTMTKLEHYGMVRGEWFKNDGVWKRKYVVAGEGTKDFIKAIESMMK